MPRKSFIRILQKPETSNKIFSLKFGVACLQAVDCKPEVCSPGCRRHIGRATLISLEASERGRRRQRVYIGTQVQVYFLVHSSPLPPLPPVLPGLQTLGLQSIACKQAKFVVKSRIYIVVNYCFSKRLL